MKKNLISMAALVLGSSLVFAYGTKFIFCIEPYQAKCADDFVVVDCGVCYMGNDDYEDAPEHEAVVSEFYICTHEVTQEEYEKIMGTNPSRCKGKNLTVENVTWYDAIEYCNRRSIAEGYTPCYTEGFELNIGADGYRLPTETEWEYAASGGNKSLGYSFSGSDELDDVAWTLENSGGKIHKVMTKTPNELGIYDMSGNVSEWCWDWFGVYPSGKAGLDPEGPTDGDVRIVRGGSYNDKAYYKSSSFRDCKNPATASANVGFRVVRSGTRG